MLRSFGFGSLLLPISLFAVLSESSLVNRMHGDLDTIKGLFEAQYAPMEWKQSFSGWSLENEIDLAKQRVSSDPNINIKEYQKILKTFFKSTQDYHVSVTFHSTESSRLPFLVKSAEGRYFIVALNRSVFPDGPLQVGDEVISFNGEPLSAAIQAFGNEEFKGDSAVSSAFSEMFFNKRFGALGQKVMQGDVTIGVRHKKTQEERVYPISWIYEPEKIGDFSPKAKSAVMRQMKVNALTKQERKKSPLSHQPAFKKTMRSPYAAYLAGEGLGDRESFIPSFGKKIWSSSPQSTFHAYLFETPDRHRYGYIRIPDYNGSDFEVEEFKELIAKFEMQSEGLIIDQLNNPGGSVFYMYALSSTLTDVPLELPKHRIAITQKEIALAVEALELLEQVESEEEAQSVIGDELDGLPVTLELAEQVKDYFYFLLSQWNLGINFTSPIHLWGYTEIIPDQDVRYTKPIMVLINEMDLSCGDFFPAIMQDNGRATLFGATTGGAGGFVLNAEYPNIFGIKEISYTGSIAMRLNDRLIENLGVNPDIEYQLTEEDLTNFYTPYKNAVLKELKNLTQ